ncbi:MULTISPECIES: hypothetical protein [unclassified Bosea (in: a-proteobacteria)]|nr:MULTISPECIES: hypothetical protein [unclassified Bosea (in: a-proteobacteria)]
MRRLVIVAILAGLGCLAVLLAALALSGFADVPCQDSSWDAAKKTCIPY